MSNGKSSVANVHREDMPFGWEQGDPLVVCVNRDHMHYVQRAFKLRAHYILPLDRLVGRRYNKIIMFHQGPMSMRAEDELRRWKDEVLATKLTQGGEIYFV